MWTKTSDKKDNLHPKINPKRKTPMGLTDEEKFTRDEEKENNPFILYDENHEKLVKATDEIMDAIINLQQVIKKNKPIGALDTASREAIAKVVENELFSY